MKKISSKPYKQWCKARKIDFKNYISQFPFVCTQIGFTIQPIFKMERKLGFWNRAVKWIMKLYKQLLNKEK